MIVRPKQKQSYQTIQKRQVMQRNNHNKRWIHAIGAKRGKACLILVTIGFGFRVLSHDVTAANMVSQKNEKTAMFVYQTSPVAV